MNIDETVDGMVKEDLMAEAATNANEGIEHEQNTAPFRLDLSFLRTPTGEGTIEDRLDHPLNPGRSMGVAQILRGVEGFTDTLRLAVLDIAFGAAEMMRERKAGSAGL